MSYTDLDVERVAEAMEEVSWSGAVKARMQGGNIAIAIEWADLARAALEAMEREPVTAEQVQAYCKKRGLVMMTKNIAEHLTRQAR